MKNKKLVLSLVLAGFVTLLICSLSVKPIAPKSVPVQTPTGNSTQRPDEHFVAALDVAKVFGQVAGCRDATPELIIAVADEALEAKLDAKTFAATVAVESACNQYATSRRGAIGLTMVVPNIWKDHYNFEKDYNLLNVHNNLHVGASIEASLIKQYGVAGGLRHYNGMGTNSPDYDAAYPTKIESLAGHLKTDKTGAK